MRGTQIIDPNGNVFVPHGVNVLGPDSWWPTATAGLSGVAQTWGFNTIRLNSCLPGGCDGTGYDWTTNNDLAAIVKEYTSAHIVVIIALHQVASGDYPTSTELSAMSSWWQNNAAEFANNPYVWFNTQNEPGSSTSASSPAPNRAQWLSLQQTLIGAIRGTGANNIIVLDGTQWGQDAGTWNTSVVPTANSALLTEGPQLAATYPNLVFSLHVYDQWGISTSATNAQRDARLTDFINRVHADNLPLMIGETGAADTTSLDALGTGSAFRVAPGLGVGILVWHGQPGDGFATTTQGPFNDIDSTTNPTNLTALGQELWTYNQSRMTIWAIPPTPR